jgi:hypothetical protein
MLGAHTVTHPPILELYKLMGHIYLPQNQIHVAWPSDYEHRASSGRDAFALQSSSADWRTLRFNASTNWISWGYDIINIYIIISLSIEPVWNGDESPKITFVLGVRFSQFRGPGSSYFEDHGLQSPQAMSNFVPQMPFWIQLNCNLQKNGHLTNPYSFSNSRCSCVWRVWKKKA